MNGNKKPLCVHATYDNRKDWYDVFHANQMVGTIVRHPQYLVVKTERGLRPKTYGECQFSTRKVEVDGTMYPNVTGSTLEICLLKLHRQIMGSEHELEKEREVE